MNFGSLFSGVGGFDLGFERAGMSCSWQVEIDKPASGVLACHWPNVARYEDVRTVGKHNLQPVDVICGGFPCQDLSIAGKRKGLDGERSGLWFEFARIVEELKPGWVVIENVPGLLSSHGGADFAVLLRGLVERGYGVAWRVLDAQYFGVAQRRRRVFVVASLGSGRAAQVLFEREGVRWDTPSRGKAGERIAGTLDGKSASSNRGSQANELDFIVMAHGQANAEVVRDGEPSITTNHEAPIVAGALSPGAHPGGFNGQDVQNIVAFQRSQLRLAGKLDELDIAPTLKSETKSGDTELMGGNNMPFVGVRRLTPVECERLQGFPDGWTAGQSDSQRYKQMGNAVCVPVAEWIGRRICER